MPARGTSESSRRVREVGAPFVHRLRVRYHECDPQGIVFNGTWFAYFDVTLTELWRAAFGSYDAMVEAGSDVMVVSAAATYRAPGRFDDELEIAMAIERLGTSSMTSAFTATRDGVTLVEGTLVHVFVDPATHTKQEIPGAAREKLAPWVVAGQPAGSAT
jgi:acyl-CoA thioester hydrolase